jgi:hypothetical protein
MKGDAPKARAPKKAKCTTRMDFSMDQHGKVPLAVTAEYATPEETAENARRAIALFKGICEENNFKMGDSPF